MNVSVKWKNGLSFTGTAGSGFLVPLGASPEVGGDNDGFRPLELMAISLAGCTAMDVISLLSKQRQEVEGFSVHVDADQSGTHPKVFTHILIYYLINGNNLDEVAIRRAIELSAVRYCPAQAMLGKVVAIELDYTITDANGNITEGKIALGN